MEGGRQAVSRETLEGLALYRNLLLRWNRTINLVSRNTENDVQRRHFDDSLQLMAYMPQAIGLAVDLGSGAGFPGLVLAIATGVQFVLIEADQRKAAFLREVIAATRAPATVQANRIEAVELEPADLVIARALAPLDALLHHAQRLLKPSGVALFLKGAQATAEVASVQHHWRMRCQVHQSRTSSQGAIVEVSELIRAA